MSAKLLLICVLVASTLLAQPFPWTVSPLGIVGNTQILSVHLTAPPAGNQWYSQVYVRIASRSGNPAHPWNACTVIFNPVINAFFMESDGTPGQDYPPWITKDGGPIFGGEPYTFPHEGSLPNNQCVFHGEGSSAVQNPNGTVDATIKITFRTPEFIAERWTSPAYAATPNIRWVWMIGYNGGWWGWDMKGTLDIRPSDTTPPVISGVSPSPSSGTAVVAWTTNEVSDSRVFYGTTPAYGSQSYSSAPETSHGLRLTNIQSGTQYYFRVESKDLAGNVSSASGSFVATGPVSSTLLITTSPGPSAASPLPPDGPCALDVISNYFDGVKQQWITIYSPRYIWLAPEAVATRPSNNSARLLGRNRLVINPAYPNKDFRQYWIPQFVLTRTFNSAPPITETWFNPSGQAVEAWADYNIQQTLGASINLGRYTSRVLAQARSTYCQQFYPGYFANPFSYNLGEASQYIDIRRPEIPVYSATTPNAPFYLGRDAFSLPIQTNGPYRSYALLTSGDSQGAVGPPTWSILSGQQFGTLECVGNPSSTTCDVTKFQSLRGSTGCLVFDVVLKANYGGLDSKEMHIFINRPYYTRAVDIGYDFHSVDPLAGWTSTFTYEVGGLCSTGPVFSGYSFMESFDASGLQSDAPGENWSSYWLSAAVTGGGTLSAGATTWRDRVTFHPAVCASACVPSVISYISSITLHSLPPLYGDRVFRIPQFFAVAPTLPAAPMTPSSIGVRVQEHTLQYYQDGAAHENIVNPAIP